MLKKIFVLFLIFLGICCYGGCARHSLPSDLPNLVSVTITVTQEGKPLADALVSLSPIDTNTKWSAIGRTDINGNTQMSTNGMYNGIVPGKYKVVILKEETEKPANPYEGAPDPKVDMDKYQEWYMKNESKIAAMQHHQAKVFTFVEEKYTSSETTPLEIEITSNIHQYNVDAGKIIKVKLKDHKK
ncbi:MAG: hypothetical protein LBP87_05435 [Planctomycetaceae bacterium]|jgi:hypothetical protein|nr:hypothetical protein [Planctomycetaceae bacterium]